MTPDIALLDYIGSRSEQQDSAQICEIPGSEGHLLVLADGVGGHVNGAAASSIATKAFADATQGGVFSQNAAHPQALLETARSANKTIAQEMQNDPRLQGMASTLVAALCTHNALHWISIGDSHLFAFQENTLKKLNEDHSQAAQMISSGRYKEDDPEVAQFRHLLRSALTGEEIELIDLPDTAYPINPNDIFILASDGIDTLSLQQIETLLQNQQNLPADKIAEEIVAQIKQQNKAHQDNIALIVFKAGQ